MGLYYAQAVPCFDNASTPALASANSQTETDLSSIAYASTYPVALIFKILLAQALVEILSRLL
jgi:uncharacterized transporter YbjL